MSPLRSLQSAIGGQGTSPTVTVQVQNGGGAALTTGKNYDISWQCTVTTP